VAQPVLNQDFFSIEPKAELPVMGEELLRGMDDEEREAIEGMHQKVQELMAQEAAQARYFQRQDNGRLVQTQREYAHCARKRIPLRIVEQDEAEALLRAEEQRGNERKEKREARKARRRRK